MSNDQISTSPSKIQQTGRVVAGAELRKIAIGLAEHFPIFPLRPDGKEPALSENWKDLASQDPKRVHSMWTRDGSTPIARNIGIRTGAPCLHGYLCVIDVDVKDGKPGLASLNELENELGPLPKTLTIRTGSGGQHLYFISPWPVGNSYSKLGPGIDVKGAGGYVVGPGSSVDGLEYTLHDGHSISDLPATWVTACGRPRERGHLDRAVPLLEGNTSAHLHSAAYHLAHIASQFGTYRVACAVRSWIVDQDECLNLIMDHWPAAEGKGYDHIKVKVSNAYTYAQDPAGIACPEIEFESVEIVDFRRPGSWHEPVDLWEQERSPIDELGGIVPAYAERFGKDRARRLGVSPGAMIAATVTTLSSLIPASSVLQMRQNSDSWAVRSIIWTALVGDPGTAKSPAVGAAMVFPEILEKSWRGDFAQSLKVFERAELAEESRKAKKSKKHSEDAQKEPTADSEIFPEAPSKPKLRRKIVNDATTEALAAVLAENPDTAPALFHSDELVGLIGGMDVYRSRGSKDRPFFLSAKDGKPYAVDRKASGTLLVPSLAISIVGTIQDDKLGKIAHDLTDDGFLQRFALVMIRKTGSGEDVPDDRFLDESVPRLAQALSGLDARGYRLHPDAVQELDILHDFSAREGQRADISMGLRTWLSKTPNEFGRYCLAFHLIEWASLAAALGDEPAPLVSREIARMARRYVQEFLYSHAQHAYSVVMAKGQNDDDVTWVAGYILTRGLETITAREISRAYRSLRGAEKRSKLLSVMASLGLQDWVKLTNSQRGEWKVNPAVHDGRFQDITSSETARRAAVRAEIAAEAEVRRAAKGGRP